MKKYLEILKKCVLFNDIADENLLAMLGCMGAVKKEIPKGKVIFATGDRVRELGIVLEGKIQLERIDYNGNRSIVSEAGPSAVFAEIYACSDIDFLPVDVVASEDSVILAVDARRITGTCSNACVFHKQIIFNLLKTVAMKGVLFDRKIEIISKRFTREKLLTYLDMEAKRNGSRRFVIPYSRQELADYLEVERSGLSSEIGKLCREGIIECVRNEFFLK